MNITELRYLVAIKKWGSVSAAAKQLYAAQPNVSKALKNLEEEYGLRIFERSSTGMIPTEQGRRFIEQAARVLEEALFRSHLVADPGRSAHGPDGRDHPDVQRWPEQPAHRRLAGFFGRDGRYSGGPVLSGPVQDVLAALQTSKRGLTQ